MTNTVYAYTEQFLFHWNKLKFEISCDISDLTNGSRIGDWPKAVVLTSHRTGNRVEFTQPVFHYDEEGDELQFVIYRSSKPVKGRTLPLKVFND